MLPATLSIVYKTKAIHPNILWAVRDSNSPWNEPVDLQSTPVPSMVTDPKFVDDTGLEPVIPACKAGVLANYTNRPNIFIGTIVKSIKVWSFHYEVTLNYTK